MGRYHDQYALAQESWREAARLNREAGNSLVAVNSLVALAELNRVQGNAAQITEKARTIMERAGISELASRNIAQASGG